MRNFLHQTTTTAKQRHSSFKGRLRRIGIISRDYRETFSNNRRDFSAHIGRILRLLDENECDAALFSMYSIIDRKNFNLRAALTQCQFKYLKAVFVEKFRDGRKRESLGNIVYSRTGPEWFADNFEQQFGSLKDRSRDYILRFVKCELPRRIFGNCLILYCGESNGVKYSMKDEKVNDEFGLREAIPKNVNLILNPVHDRMTRFEMRRKRKFLSERGRWVISVWNRGKTFNGRTRDGSSPPWTVYNNGREVELREVSHDIESVSIGIVDIGRS
jgi:hypothetical protein